MGSRPSATAATRADFWRGLTTPSPVALVGAAVLLAFFFAIISFRAAGLRERQDRGVMSVQGIENDVCRSSVTASRGEEKETAADSVALVFTGPSSLRCWLPHPEEAEAIASLQAGRPVKVVSMCSNQQSLPLTAALVDEFGAGFDGWFVIGASRQSLARRPQKTQRQNYNAELSAIGFESGLMRKEGEMIGYKVEGDFGWELWNRRNFYYHCRLGYDLPFHDPAPYQPFFDKRPINVRKAISMLSKLDEKTLKANLGLLDRLVGRVRASGTARVALVETPWLDTFDPAVRGKAWQKEEETYRKLMTEWSAKTGVPWLSQASRYKASGADFSDPRHVDSKELRGRFLNDVTRELISLRAL